MYWYTGEYLILLQTADVIKTTQVQIGSSFVDDGCSADYNLLYTTTASMHDCETAFLYVAICYYSLFSTSFITYAPDQDDLAVLAKSSQQPFSPNTSLCTFSQWQH